MRLEVIEFKVKDGEVICNDSEWVYVWVDPSASVVIKVGATWLHPAARAEKHLKSEKTSSANVTAFRIPDGINRQHVKVALIDQLRKANRLSEELFREALKAEKVLASSNEHRIASEIYQALFQAD